MQATTSTRAPVGTAAFRAPKRAAASPRRPFAPTLPQCQRPLHLARAEGDGGEQPPQQAAAPKAPEQQQQQQAQQEDEPVWVRRERERQLQKQEGGMRDLPFGAYLLFSSFTAIAAVGSIFEYVNKNAIFDVIQPDSPLYAPILGFFAVTGLPTSGLLFYRAVQSANKEAERMDKLDGY
ncbi:hypothetical protein ACK3TF_000673 [Chlorella vulgaris]